MQRAPAFRAVQLRPLGKRQSLVIIDVRRKLGVAGEQRTHLGLDRISGRFERRQPRKVLAIVEFTSGQAGIVKVRWLLGIGLGTPQAVVDEALETVCCGWSVGRLDRRDSVRDNCRLGHDIGAMALDRAVECR